MKKHINKSKKSLKSPEKLPKISNFFSRVDKCNLPKCTEKEYEKTDDFISLESGNSSNVKIEIIDDNVKPSSCGKKRKGSECEIKLIKKKCESPSTSTSTNRSPLHLLNVTPSKRKKSSIKNLKKSDIGTTGQSPQQKLFQKSPMKVEKFKAEVIENFVTITPTKKNISNTSPSTTPTSSGKFQTSILKYMSPSTSNRKEEAQKNNENTPKKESVTEPLPSNAARVRTKINFDEMNESSEIKKKQQVKEDAQLAKECLEEFSVTEFFDMKFEEVCLSSGSFEPSNMEEKDHLLDLSESKRCKVKQIEIFTSYWRITVQSTLNNEYAKVVLRDFWLNTKLEAGDNIHISARKVNSEWLVDNHGGLVVYEPDYLISSTSVVGSLVHYILQETLRKKLNSMEQIEEQLKFILSSKENVKRIYESGQSLEELENDVLPYIKRVFEFIENYVECINVKDKKSKFNTDCWRGKITEIVDIEENIWCPQLGLKGKVDVSIKSADQIMPLELKTGRPSFSLEHKGQVLLYIMMMNQLGYKVPSGLLLYLRDGIVKEVPASQNEKRDIIMLRNELAYFLSKKSKIVETQSEVLDKKIQLPELPDPINHPSACAQCPYNIVCTSLLEYNKFNLSSNKYLRKIKAEVLSHLEEQHINYFVHWSGLIDLEKKVLTKPLHEIYTSSPEDRESKGRCISSLEVTEISGESNGLMNHTFEKKEKTSFNFRTAGIEKMSYCVVSTDLRPAIVTGFVTNLDTHSITVSLDRNLRKKFPLDHFHIDTYESNVSESFNLGSLSLLLEPTSRGQQLRRIIIEKGPPSFLQKLPKIVATKGLPILKKLNKIQQRAILKSLSTNDYLLIKGMPGTGKTATIVSLIQLLSELDKTVLITSHTHSAVDTICTRLHKLGIDFLRLGSDMKIDKSLRKYTETSKTNHCTTPEELEQVYNGAKIIASTCLGSGHPVLSKRILDFCIVDESTQVLQATLIRPLYAAKKFILIGDPEQLPPVVRNQEAVKLGMAVSLFERLQNEENTIALTLNYRMNSVLTELSNNLTYGGQLLVANDKVAKATLHLPHRKMFETCSQPQWVLKALNSELKNSVQFFDTGPIWQKNDEILRNMNGNEIQGSIENIYEVAVVLNIVNVLLERGVDPNNIGVMAPYTSQVKKLSLLLNENIAVNTVDQFQGKDKDIIFYSCTKSSNVEEGLQATVQEPVGILQDHHRLNVAVTRAKHKLIMVGDAETMRRYKPFKKLLEFINSDRMIRLKDGVDGFSWKSISNNVKAS